MDESTTSGFWFSPHPNPSSKSTEKKPEVNERTDGERIENERPQPAPLKSSISSEPGVPVLIWNTNRSEALQIEQNLHIAGYTNTFCATTYNEGLHFLDKQMFDVFLVDIDLGEISGLQLVKALRDSNTYRYTPVFITTQEPVVEDMLNAMKAGANDLMSKPLTPEILTQKISLHLKVSSFA